MSTGIAEFLGPSAGKPVRPGRGRAAPKSKDGDTALRFPGLTAATLGANDFDYGIPLVKSPTIASGGCDTRR